MAILMTAVLQISWRFSKIVMEQENLSRLL